MTVQKSTSQGKVETTMGRNSFFGELNLFVDLPSEIQVTTKTHAQIFVLQKSDYKGVLDSFVETRKYLQEHGKERYTEVKRLKVRPYSLDTQVIFGW